MNREQAKILHDFQERGYLVIDHDPVLDIPEILQIDIVDWRMKGGNWADSFDATDPAYPALFYVEVEENKPSQLLVYVLIDEGTYCPISELEFKHIKVWKNEELNI